MNVASLHTVSLPQSSKRLQTILPPLILNILMLKINQIKMFIFPKMIKKKYVKISRIRDLKNFVSLLDSEITSLSTSLESSSKKKYVFIMLNFSS